jgi:hypothetical protein
MRDGISDSKIAEYFALTTYELEKGTVYKFTATVDIARFVSQDKIKDNIKFIEDDRENKKGS